MSVDSKNQNIFFLLKRQVSQLTNVRISGCHCPCPLEISWVAPRILHIGKNFMIYLYMNIIIYQACTTMMNYRTEEIKKAYIL